MFSVQFHLNGRAVAVEVADPELPLLFLLREYLKLTGTKYGCGEGVCGACTVHLDGQAARSCQIPVRALAGVRVTTIEGLSPAGEHPVQRAWIEGQVPQCGYCQPGQIMQAAALLAENPRPTTPQIAAAMAGNLCRCGTTPRILAAVAAAAQIGSTERHHG